MAEQAGSKPRTVLRQGYGGQAAQPRKSGFGPHAVNAYCVETLFLYAVQR